MDSFQRWIGSVLILTWLAAAPLSSQSNGIVGTWRLVSAEDRFPDGRIECPFGERASGTIIYDENGHMPVQIMRQGRTKWAAFEDGSREPLLSYVAYFGTYDVDERSGKVTHHIQGHLDPKPRRHR